MNPDESRTPNPAQAIHPVQPIQPARTSVQPVQPITPEAIAAALSEPPAVPPATVVPVVDSPTPVTAPPTVAPPVPTPPVAAPSVPVATQQPVQSEPINEQYNEATDDQVEDGDAVTWVAKEYIHHEKDSRWFIIFGVVVVVLLAVAIFFMKSWTFAVLLAVIAVGVVVYSRRPPRELTYSLTDDGLVIDDVLQEFDKFKSFGVIQDGEEYSVMLIPTQRFQPGVTVYFPEEAGEDIVDMLGSRLPMKELHLDAVDRLIRLIRL